MLYKTEFPSAILQFLFCVSEHAWHPVFWSINEFTTPYILSTEENQWDISIVIKRVLYPLLLLAVLAVFCIPAIFGLLVRCFLHLIRRPYILSVDKSWFPRTSTDTHNSTSTKNRRNSQVLLNKLVIDKKYTICSTNVCLLPELLSRFNNLPRASARSYEIGQRIVVDQFFFQNAMDSLLRIPPRQRKKSKSEGISLDSRILTHFPKLDFLCLQETWDRKFSKQLISELHKVFPWILYDIGKTNFFINKFGFNSGLMFASKHEILDVDFKPYNHSVSQCIFNSKGLLMVKVLVSSTEHCDKVGYIFNTHLQAYQGKSTALQKQLQEIIQWTNTYRLETVKPSDVVVFDVLCGDFNFDNLSPVDEPCFTHELFDIYEDVCRIRPGQDHNWTVGTEMRQMCFWEEQVLTPDGLKEALADPILRHRHMVDANIKDGTMHEIVNTRPLKENEIETKLKDLAGRRRIDYILYRKDTPVVPQNFSFITRLSTLTDHIPVSMTFSCQT